MPITMLERGQWVWVWATIFSSTFALWAKSELYMLVISLTHLLTYSLIITHSVTPGVENYLKDNVNSLFHHRSGWYMS